MNRSRPSLIVLTFVALLALAPRPAFSQTHQTTRIADAAQQRRRGDKNYPYRSKSDYILEELDLQAGDVVADIGAGDGWWSEKFSLGVGESGVIHAGEVVKNKVEQMKKRFADTPQVKPYLIETDSTGLPENSCDVVFFSQSYHHLNKDGQVDYLKHLHSVVKPTGRVVIIEKYTETGLGSGTHGTRLSQLVRQAEEAGWVPVRLELMTGTYHYIAILAQQEMFPPEPEKKTSGKSKPTKTADSKGHTSDSLEMVQKQLSDKTAVLIDVREKNEWDAGHLLQATLVPLSQLRSGAGQAQYGQELVKRLPLDKIIYCHCASGGRVLVAAPILRKMGYDVRPLKAGYRDLLKAGFLPKKTEE